MTLPESFCWTRFGTEAGQPIEYILARKERERVANGGVFLWGIGNAVGPSIAELVRRQPKPEVVFSPIHSRPKPGDVKPPAVAVWTQGEALDNETYQLPEHSLVTSRYDPVAPKRVHYAVVCHSAEPLLPLRSTHSLTFGQLRNLLTGRPVGASQVTAIVDYRPEPSTGICYDVSIRAELAYPYFVRLRHPLILGKLNDHAELSEASTPLRTAELTLLARMTARA